MTSKYYSGDEKIVEDLFLLFLTCSIFFRTTGSTEIDRMKKKTKQNNGHYKFKKNFDAAPGCLMDQ